jgi:hypothetical protein
MTDLDEEKNLVSRVLHFFNFISNIHVFSNFVENLESD